MCVLSTPLPQTKHNLPVLFQFSHPTHNVAVFRGAQLKQAIEAGLVTGFGNAGGDATEGREGRSEEGGDGSSEDATATSYAIPTTTTPPPPPPTTTTAAYVAPTTAAPVYKPSRFVYTPTSNVYKPAPAPIIYKPAPAPIVYKPAPAPIVYKPAPAPIVYKPAPAPIVYKPAPAPIVYKPSPAPAVYKPAPAPLIYTPAPSYKAPSSYVEPSYADIPAKYDWEYSVKDDYTNNDFGAKESRDGYLTNGKYYVALPDGRVQTVTYVVDGGEGYVPLVEYTGEAQYPPEKPADTYSA